MSVCVHVSVFAVRLRVCFCAFVRVCVPPAGSGLVPPAAGPCAAGAHAAPEGSAGVADTLVQGQHPVPAGRAVADPRRATESAGPEHPGETHPPLNTRQPFPVL